MLINNENKILISGRGIDYLDISWLVFFRTHCVYDSALRMHQTQTTVDMGIHTRIDFTGLESHY